MGFETQQFRDRYVGQPGNLYNILKPKDFYGRGRGSGQLGEGRDY